MGVLDGPLRGVAKQLTSLLGTTATLRRRTAVFDPIANAEVVTNVTWSLRVSPPEAVGLDRIDGTLVRAGDAKCVAAAADIEALSPAISLPTGSAVNLYLDVAGDRWAIVAVNDMRSGDQSAAVELILRR